MKDRYGFSLTGLLKVVVIIAVFVAISIPIIISQMERSREATDMSSLRVAYVQAAGIASASNGEGVAVTSEMRSKGTFDHIEVDKVDWYDFTHFKIVPGQTYEVHVDAHDAAAPVVKVVAHTETP